MKNNKYRLFCCNYTCYCVGMVSVTSASRYVTSASRYQSRSSMYIRGLVPRDWLRQSVMCSDNNLFFIAVSS